MSSSIHSIGYFCHKPNSKTSTLKHNSLLSSSFLSPPPLLAAQFSKKTNFLILTNTKSKKRMGVTVMSMEAGIGVMATKLGMMSFFEPNGKVVPVTVVGFREGNIVTQIKTQATDGYDAVQVGYRRVRDKKLTKPEMGHLEKAGAIPMRHLQEFRLQSIEGFEPNQRLIFEELFKEGDLVDVSGTTIGKGFQGLSFFFSPPFLFSFCYDMILVYIFNWNFIRNV